MPDTVAFIGAGNMAISLVNGLLTTGCSPNRIIAADPVARSRERMSSLGIRTETQNSEAVSSANVVVLAVKPQVLETVCREIAAVQGASERLYLSIAAGIETQSLRRWLGEKAAIVRCMPNTPALVGHGASVLFATNTVSSAQRAAAQNLLEAVGLTAWVEDESLMHAVTAVSGSGPAYIFLLIEAMQSAGEQLGLPASLSKALAVQTAKGAAEMARTSELDVAELRRQVTSPGGTTERALASFESQGFRELVSRALTACARRSMELAEEFGRS